MRHEQAIEGLHISSAEFREKFCKRENLCSFCRSRETAPAVTAAFDPIPGAGYQAPA